MRLAAIEVSNYKRIGAIACFVRIDEIVVLIGPNNSGKSTILDAYEVFASSGKELDESHFNDPKNHPIEITGIFNALTPADEEVISGKWSYDDANFGRSVKVKWVWSEPGIKGTKWSHNPTTGLFEEGGVGGWDSLWQSRIPQPLRIRPTDSLENTQTKIVGMLKEYVKTSLKANSGSTKAAFDEIELLAKKVFEASKASFDDVSKRITDTVSQIFPETTIEIVPRSKDIDEKLIAADSYLRIGTKGSNSSPLLFQGTGLQRALLWSALSVMSETPGKKKTKANEESKRILLIDEPEAFLHPPTIRNARESLYEFALKNTEWQVLATTHSPIFIDLSKDHTTIVRVDATNPNQHYVSTDLVSFDAAEKERLRMVRSCNAMVNEFFFYDNIVLVEGPTEHMVVKHVARLMERDVHVIDCMGKGNLPLFAKILNHFKLAYVIIHDSDTPKYLKKGTPVNSGTWTLNTTIRDAAVAKGFGQVFTQFPHFEGHFLDAELDGGKVDHVLEVLNDEQSAEYKHIVATYMKVLSSNPDVMTTTVNTFDDRKNEYITKKALANDHHWS